MKRKMIKVLVIALMISLLGTMLSACSPDSSSNSDQGNSSGSTSGNTQQTSAESDPLLADYPIKTDVTITYWMHMNPNASSQFSNLSETVFAQELRKRTGIKIEFLHPADWDQFNLIMAAGDMPDIMEYRWENAYPGGVPKAIADGKALPLNDLMEKGYVKNYVSFLKENPEIAKMIQSSDGQYAGFPYLFMPQEVGYGTIARKDWLDKLGMAVPETIDEWHAMLKAFKEKMGATAPYSYVLTMDEPLLAGAFDTGGDFYVKDGKIMYGPADPGFKQGLEVWHQWYMEGLVDKDLATISRELTESKMTTGEAGVTFSYTTMFPNMEKAGALKDPAYKLVPLPYPVLEKGQKPRFDSSYSAPPYNKRVTIAMITTDCKNPEAAARLLDYAYSEEGNMLYNYGVEGESYVVNSDGSIAYTDKIHNDTEGRSFSQMRAIYSRSYSDGPYAHDLRRSFAENILPVQKQSIETWSNNSAFDFRLPMLRHTEEENQELGNIMTEIKTYKDEMHLKFMLGDESLDNFDRYVAEMKSMGLDRVIEIMQKALDTYNAG